MIQYTQARRSQSSLGCRNIVSHRLPPRISIDIPFDIRDTVYRDSLGHVGQNIHQRTRSLPLAIGRCHWGNPMHVQLSSEKNNILKLILARDVHSVVEARSGYPRDTHSMRIDTGTYDRRSRAPFPTFLRSGAHGDLGNLKKPGSTIEY